jgi:hypothetical protein
MIMGKKLFLPPRIHPDNITTTDLFRLKVAIALPVQKPICKVAKRVLA